MNVHGIDITKPDIFLISPCSVFQYPASFALLKYVGNGVLQSEPSCQDIKVWLVRAWIRPPAALMKQSHTALSDYGVFKP